MVNHILKDNQFIRTLNLWKINHCIIILNDKYSGLNRKPLNPHIGMSIRLTFLSIFSVFYKISIFLILLQIFCIISMLISILF